MITVCGKTGLATVERSTSAFRVAKTSYGPLKPQERVDGEDRTAWYRFDTPGRTIYAAEDRKTAFLEALSWARATADFLDSLQKTADFFGITVEEVRKEVTDDWARFFGMKPGYIPVIWREDRKIYHLEFESGRWVDIAHGETILALGRALRSELMGLGVTETLTISEITSGNRELTTLLASWIREQALDDGTYPLGIRFPSKHGATGQGHGHCWAFWLRRTDVGLTNEPVKVVSETEIAKTNSAFKQALKHHDIKSW